MSESLTRREMLTESTWGVLRRLRDKVGELASRMPEAPGSAFPGDDGQDGDLARWLRPPGALEEEAFLAKCTRCDDCIRACPHGAIRKLGREVGAEVAGTPAVLPDETPCYLCADMPCVTACGEGALGSVTPDGVRMGTAVIDDALCYAFRGQPCDYCLEKCPLGSTAVQSDDVGRPRIVDAGCAGCGVCAFLCPPRAIVIEARRR